MTLPSAGGQSHPDTTDGTDSGVTFYGSQGASAPLASCQSHNLGGRNGVVSYGIKATVTDPGRQPETMEFPALLCRIRKLCHCLASPPTSLETASSEFLH